MATNNESRSPDGTRPSEQQPSNEPPTLLWDELSERFSKHGNVAVFTFFAERYGPLLFTIVKNQLRGRRHLQDREDLLKDVLIGIVQWVAEGLTEYPEQTKTIPLDALVRTKARRVIIDWLRKKSQREQRLCLLGETILNIEDPGTPEPEGRNVTYDLSWDRFERNLNNIIEVLGFTEHECKVFRAYFDLQREYAGDGKKCPKRDSIPRLVERVSQQTGQTVTRHYVQRHLKTGRAKYRAYLERTASQLLGDEGDPHGQYQEAKGARTGAQGPGRLRYPRGGGQR